MKNGIVYLLCVLSIVFIYSSQGPYSSASFSSQPLGDVDWTHPSFAQTSDNSYATAILESNSTGSFFLLAENFGFSIPSGSIINGIVVDVERKASLANEITDYEIRLVKGGEIRPYDRGSGVYYPTTDTYMTYGSSSDSWGENWSYSEINSSVFGFAFSSTQTYAGATVYVDHIRITVYYTVLSGRKFRVFGDGNGMPTTEAIG